LASRKFLFSSQRLLFHSLSVHNSNAQTLARSLGHPTHIASYVRDLEIDFDFDHEDMRAVSVALLPLFLTRLTICGLLAHGVIPRNHLPGYPRFSLPSVPRKLLKFSGLLCFPFSSL
jgi:hypothetical protein